MKAMQLIARHCAYWLLTLLEEMLNEQTKQPASESLEKQVQRLMKQTHSWLAPEDQRQLPDQLNSLIEAHTKQQTDDWGDRTAHSLLALLRPELQKQFSKEADPEEAFFRYLIENSWG